MLSKRNEHWKAQPVNWAVLTALIEKQWTRLDELVAKDALTNGADFYLASQLADDPMGWFEQRQKQHELAATALLLDEPSAPMLVARTWDQLMISMARKQRFGTMQSYDREAGKPGPPDVDPLAAPALRALLLDTATGRRVASSAVDNKELQDIRTADQKAREFDFARAT